MQSNSIVYTCGNAVWINEGFEEVMLFCQLLDGHEGKHTHEDVNKDGVRVRVQWELDTEVLPNDE